MIDYAYALENNVLTEWDDTPRAELAWFTERYRYQARVRAGKLDAQRVPVLFLGAMPPVFAPDQLQQLLGLKRHRHSADNTKDHHYGN